MISFERGSYLIICVLACFLSTCGGLGARKAAKTTILQAQKEIPEEELLDVGLAVFTSGEITEKQQKKQGTNPDVRNAECHFIPYHLKNTLEQSGYWGMVRVMPVESDAADVLVSGEIIASNGENLVVEVTVSDSTGKRWFKKKYKAKIENNDYAKSALGQKDAFQGLYNAIANDMAAHSKKLSSKNIKEIRTISKLKFARDFAPSVFEDYVVENKGRYAINRLPSDDDPMMARVLRIREREYMFEDTLNEYYEQFYNEMWPPYENWRMLNLTERIALAQQRRDSILRTTGGALLVALAVLLQTQGVSDSAVLTGALVVAGGQVFLSGVNISKQAEMHYEALRELGESFGSEMEPIIVEFEGKRYELTGSAKEQYARWRELLREIYYAETGFDPSENYGDSAERL